MKGTWAAPYSARKYPPVPAPNVRSDGLASRKRMVWVSLATYVLFGLFTCGGLHDDPCQLSNKSRKQWKGCMGTN